MTTGLLLVGFVVAFAWSWRVSEIDLLAFIEGTPAGLRLARAFLVPELFTRPTEEHAVGAVLPVPC